MPKTISCPDCYEEIPQPAATCPHCARPGIFWNVRTAAEDNERSALAGRYRAAMDDAAARQVESIVADFEWTLVNSGAVIARSEQEVMRLANSTRQLHGTYYQWIEAGLRIPDNDEWSTLRVLADSMLFPDYKQQISFAALTLDGKGLTNYGSCSVLLREDRISHRASVFEENSALFIEKMGIRPGKPELPEGLRAVWNERERLCVAKLAGRIDAGTTADEYSRILLSQGASSREDDFVEVHIFGPISVLTFAKVVVSSPNNRKRATIVKAIKSKLSAHGVSVEG